MHRVRWNDDGIACIEDALNSIDSGAHTAFEDREVLGVTLVPVQGHEDGFIVGVGSFGYHLRDPVVRVGCGFGWVSEYVEAGALVKEDLIWHARRYPCVVLPRGWTYLPYLTHLQGLDQFCAAHSDWYKFDAARTTEKTAMFDQKESDKGGLWTV